MRMSVLALCDWCLRVLVPPELELLMWAVMWVLGTELRSCVRATSTVNSRAISPAPTLHFWWQEGRKHSWNYGWATWGPCRARVPITVSHRGGAGEELLRGCEVCTPPTPLWLRSFLGDELVWNISPSLSWQDGKDLLDFIACIAL